MDKTKSPVKLFVALLNLIHILYTFIEIIYNTSIFLWTTIYKCCHAVLGGNIQCVDSKFRGLKKIPQHLAVILGPEEPSFKDLVNIIIWCTGSGIPFVSFYDHNGILKKSQEEFHKTITNVTGLTLKNGVWSKHEAPFNGFKNGFTRRIHITVLDLTDGQPSIVEAAKHFISSKSDITIDNIDNYLCQRLGNIPDPDLAIYCGDLCATYGFLPWQIRVTEFINLKSHHNVSVNEFFSILQFFSTCEQRFGK